MMQIVSNELMAEEDEGIQQRRRANFQRWIDLNCNGSVARASRESGKSDSMLRGVLAGKKAFGEKLARSIEKNLNLDEEEFDKPSKSPPPRKLEDWPFQQFRREFEGLKDHQQQSILHTVRGMLIAFSSQPVRNAKKKAQAP